MRVVLCHGCFDILHIGHLRHLEAASLLGDILVVSITADAYITKPGRPIFNENDRADMLRALRCVDQVHISHESTGVGAIEQFVPTHYVKGPDYVKTGIDRGEREACLAVGALIVYTDTRKYSSTALLA